jgi:hypothetical protein
MPEGVITAKVNPETGLRDDGGIPDVFYAEYPPRRDESFAVPVPATGRDIREQLF